MKLGKPKSHVIDDLVKNYLDSLEEQEKNELRKFNTSVKKLSQQIKLPKHTHIDTTTLDIADADEITE